MAKRERNSFKTPLVVEVMPGGKTFRLHHSFTYRWKRIGVEITAPVGFVTDFASIPRLFRMVIPKLGRYNKAAVLHDAIYQNASNQFYATYEYRFTRKQADLCFLDAMYDLGVAKWKRTLMYWSVRIGAGMAWRKR